MINSPFAWKLLFTIAYYIIDNVSLIIIVNINADTFNLHRLKFSMKNPNIACSYCLHCFREGNIQTLDRHVPKVPITSEIDQQTSGMVPASNSM